MATILDLGLLSVMDMIFPFLLVFALIYAILHKFEPLGKSAGINALISVVVAMMVLLSETVTAVINFMIPWFAIFIIFLILMLLTFAIFGAKDTDYLGYLKNNNSVGWALLGVSLLIILAALGNVLGQNIGPYLDEQAAVQDGDASSTATGNYMTNLMATLFNPKILGMIVIFIIAIFAVILLTGNVS